MRAIRARYDPYKQARGRVDQLRRLGHSVDKVEFILMGGTFMSLPMDYRDYFVRNLHDDRDEARFLFDTAPVGNVVLWVHPVRNWVAVHVRGRCAGYKPGTHCGRCRRVL